ncbi:MAG: hypothetical protein GXY26_02125 [Clostridiales bacterium]|jgi:hypothetical protein|nr:hypothetical protein [Clostridiales bacterium]
MNTKLKGAVLGVLIVAAIVCSVLAFSGLGYADGENDESVSEGTCYVLRDYEGHVAVFVENDPDIPMTVTDIQVNTLRELDRETMRTGLKVRSQERLMMILEDLGS